VGRQRYLPLHLPGIRILYELDEDAAIIYVINVAATA
jgi:hypothetical protein